MPRPENLPSIKQQRDEEEEEDNEVGGLPRPRDGAGQGQGAAVEAVDVETSGTGHGHRNVPSNKLGDSVVQSARRVIFSLGVSRPPGRGSPTTGHMSQGRGARASQGGGESSDQLGAKRGSVLQFFVRPAVKGPASSGRTRSHEQVAGRSRGHDQSNIMCEQEQAYRCLSGPPQWQQQDWRVQQG